MQERTDNAIVPADPRNDVLVLGPSQYASTSYAPAPGESPPPNFLRLVHNSLRGRYPIVIALALIAAVAGGVGGFMMGRPMYRTEAIIRIHPRLPKIIYDTEQTSITPMFNSFVNTQAALVQNDRVISRAVNSDEWRKLGRTNLPKDVMAFRRSLRVAPNREAPELINISFTDPESIAAKVGIEQVLKAYQTFSGDIDGGEFLRLQRSTLETLQRSLGDNISTLRNDIRREATQYGTDDLTQLHTMQMQDLIGLMRLIRELQVAIAERSPSATPSSPPGAAPATGANQPRLEATPEQIAAIDAFMADYLNGRRRLEGELAGLKSQGVGASHPSFKKVSADIDSLNGIIAEYARIWNANSDVRPNSDAPGAGETLEQLQARLDRFTAKAESWRADAVELGNKRLNIEAKRRDIDDFQLRLDDVNNRLNQINIESKVEQAIGRLEIIPPESAPSSPTVDPRKKYAVLGGGLGGASVVGLALLLGMIDRRCRYSDEVNQTADGKLIACLPVMARSRGEDDALAAVHSLHRVRAQMQIVSSEQRTIAITSANAGDGKTSLCLSLGVSFAGVGHRTLLIDLDLVGHGLSSRLRMCEGPGILDALGAGNPTPFVRSCHSEGLDVLPVGAGVDASPARLRRQEIQALLRSAAASYDTVLIDTGPLLGSLEANFVCSSADAVLLVVGRGQSRALVRRAIDHIRDINAHLLGVVFNRARDRDFRSSSVSASFRSVRATPGSTPPGTHTAPAGFDPLTEAVFVDAQSYRDQHSDRHDAAAPAA